MAGTITMPMNRVEGDLEIKVAVENNRVVDAWAIGTLFRGFEKMMIGRGALDGLVITPRICGICSTSHLLAAARALDRICDAEVAENGRIIRHLALATEKLQSDIRHTILIFAADLVNPAYNGKQNYSEIRQRFTPFKGESVVQTIRATKHLPEIITIIGGQWPHSSFIVPGGITSQPTTHDVRQCRMILATFREWYETQILGCSIERWQQVQSLEDMENWLEESSFHNQGDLGFLFTVCRSMNMHRMGTGHDSFLAVSEHQLVGNQGSPGGFLHLDTRNPLDEQKIVEQVRYSRYESPGEGNHPMLTATHPARKADRGKYSWCKAPRYDGQPVETGPLAEGLLAGDNLLMDMKKKYGNSVLCRILARLTRPAKLLPLMNSWLESIVPEKEFHHSCPPPMNGEGVGLAQVPRGILGHWIQVANGVIEHYQVIAPTTWNASPRDSDDVRGPMEEALINTPVRDPDNPVEIGHVVRSFDPCMVCSVHALTADGRPLGTVRLGF
jgi:hydrogenase large subunit